jgi:hypothetical protein
MCLASAEEGREGTFMIPTSNSHSLLGKCHVRDVPVGSLRGNSPVREPCTMVNLLPRGREWFDNWPEIVNWPEINK